MGGVAHGRNLVSQVPKKECYIWGFFGDDTFLTWYGSGGHS